MGGRHMDPRHGRRTGLATGFTLIEMLVVIAIIAIVVVIAFPALAGARNAARRAATTALMTDLGKACDQFQIDNRRAPGYYSSRIMGGQQNMNTEGFTNMENIMLDLAGGIVVTPPAGETTLQVGPTSINPNPSNPEARVHVLVRLIGAKHDGRSQYWSPDERNFVSRNGNGQVGSQANRDLPDVVDSWGTPILAWVQDDIVSGQDSFFALEHSGSANDRGRYYWASNAGHLKSTALGKLGKPQATPTGAGREDEQSLLGPQWSWDARARTMAGLLGNPVYPEPASPPDNPIPSRGRAGIVFHSAGTDGIFLNRRDTGGKQAAAAGGGGDPFVRYNPPAPATTPGAPLPKPIDPLDGFDDLVVTSIN